MLLLNNGNGSLMYRICHFSYRSHHVFERCIHSRTNGSNTSRFIWKQGNNITVKDIFRVQSYLKRRFDVVRAAIMPTTNVGRAIQLIVHETHYLDYPNDFGFHKGAVQRPCRRTRQHIGNTTSPLVHHGPQLIFISLPTP